MQLFLFYLQLSFSCAAVVFMIDYSLGKPGDEQFNTKSLLFSWSFFLAKLRLKKIDAWDQLFKQLHVKLLSANTKKERIDTINSFKMIVFQTAQPFFTYEMIMGMCPVCTHLWITLIIFLTVNICYFQVNIFTFMFYLSLSHLFIRLFKRI